MLGLCGAARFGSGLDQLLDEASAGLEPGAEVHHGELGRVPQLVAEEAVALDAKHVQVDVAT